MVDAPRKYNIVRSTVLEKNAKTEDEKKAIPKYYKEEIPEELVKKIRGFSKMTNIEQAQIKAPYMQTSLMVNELINLEHEIKGTNVKIKERSGMRKDRYSSLEYNYYTVQQLALKLKPKKQTNNYVDMFKIRQPKMSRRF